MPTLDASNSATPPQSAASAAIEWSPIATIEYWKNAYSPPAGDDPHFWGHGMVAALLTEYLELRRKIQIKQSVQVVDLKALAYDSLAAAATRSNWMPPDYCANDWLADCRRWLEFGPPVNAHAVESTTFAETGSTGQGLSYDWVDAQAREDLLRFCETSADNEGYDVPKARMAHLAQLGLVRRVSGSIYEITEFGRRLEDALAG